MTLNEILHAAMLKGASDIFLIAGIPVTFKIKGMQDRQDSGIMKPDSINAVINEIYDVAKRQMAGAPGCFLQSRRMDERHGLHGAAASDGI